MEVKSVSGVIPRRLNDQVLAGPRLGLLAWLAAAWVSPCLLYTSDAADEE